ncbi:hypothetical protein C1646_764494 [Rhizophagus diaphanus]|nr:hypothetical protein C1646_764494 [Rhizophagus diaphanus] [Rhizophagus sp. MUCL 43196]
MSALLNSFLRPGTPLKGFLTHAQRLYLLFILFTKPLLTYNVLAISIVEKPSLFWNWVKKGWNQLGIG